MMTQKNQMFMAEQIPEGYKKTEVGILPEDWLVEPLENFTNFISYGFTNPMPTAIKGPYMLTAKDINGGKIQYKNARQTTIGAFNKLLTSKSKPIKNDLLLTKDGTLGRLALVEDELVCINQSVAVLRPNQRIVPKFFQSLLESDYYQDQMLENAGGSTIKHIYITVVNKMLLGLPNSLSEQQKIAIALSDTDALIFELEKLIEKKQAIKTATMQQLLTGKTRLPEFALREDGTPKGYKDSELGQIPEDWEVKNLTDIAMVTMGQSPDSNFYNAQGEGLPLVQGNADIKNRKTIIRNFTSFITKKALKGDLILSVRAPVGEVAKATFDCCIGRGVCAIKYPNDYLYYWLINFENKWEKFSKGSTFDSINSDELKNIFIPFPLEQEQIAISNMLANFDHDIEKCELKLNKLLSIKSGMMQELLTGKTRLV